MSLCRISEDPLADFYCLYLEWHHGVDSAALDTGWEETRFVPSGPVLRPVRVRAGVGDALADPQEVYQRLLFVEPDLLDARWNDDAAVRALLQGGMDRIRASLVPTRLIPGSLAYSTEFGRRIFSYLTRPPAQGGLGLSFDTADGGARSLSDIIQDRKATCLEFANLYLTAAEIAGLLAAPVELFEDGGAVRMHVAVGFFDPSTHELRTVADLQAPGRFGPPLRSEVWSEISRRELLSYYYNARAVRNPNRLQGEIDLDFALRLNLGNYLLLFNKACFAADRDEWGEARDLLMESIGANPNFGPAYFNLNAVAIRLRDDPLAHWAWSRYAAVASCRRPSH